MSDFDIIEFLKDKYGDSFIIKNNRPVGVCVCNGQGSKRCKGLGYEKNFDNSLEMGYFFTPCVNLRSFEELKNEVCADNKESETRNEGT